VVFSRGIETAESASTLAVGGVTVKRDGDSRHFRDQSRRATPRAHDRREGAVPRMKSAEGLPARCVRWRRVFENGAFVVAPQPRRHRTKGSRTAISRAKKAKPSFPKRLSRTGFEQYPAHGRFKYKGFSGSIRLFHAAADN